MQNHFSLTLHGTDISKCYNGREIWDWYFSLTYRATKQALTSYPGPPFTFVFPHFLTPQISRCGNRTANALSMRCWTGTEYEHGDCHINELTLPIAVRPEISEGNLSAVSSSTDLMLWMSVDHRLRFLNPFLGEILMKEMYNGAVYLSHRLTAKVIQRTSSHILRFSRTLRGANW